MPRSRNSDSETVPGPNYYATFIADARHRASAPVIARLRAELEATQVAELERLYGRLVFGGFYVLCAVGASIASFVFGSDVPSVGASGAIFGLFGVIVASSRIHHPMLDRQGRARSLAT